MERKRRDLIEPQRRSATERQPPSAIERQPRDSIERQPRDSIERQRRSASEREPRAVIARKGHRRGRQAAAGMTFLDVLIAVGLLSVGGAGLLATELVVVNAGQRSRQLTEASSSAREEIERLVYATALPSSGHDTVDGFGCSSTSACTQRGTVYSRTWNVTAGTPMGLQVSVSFRDPAGKQHAVVLHGFR